MKWKRYAKIGLAGLVLNGCAFTQVGMQKLCGFDEKQSAMINTMTASPYSISIRTLYAPIYGLGYSLGHKIFYNNADYAKIGEEELKKIRDHAEETTKKIFSIEK